MSLRTWTSGGAHHNREGRRTPKLLTRTCQPCQHGDCDACTAPTQAMQLIRAAVPTDNDLPRIPVCTHSCTAEPAGDAA